MDEFLAWWWDDGQNRKLKKKLKAATSAASVRRHLKDHASAGPTSAARGVGGVAGVAVATGMAVGAALHMDL